MGHTHVETANPKPGNRVTRTHRTTAGRACAFAQKDPMPKLSYQQELMLFVQPTEGSIPTHHRNQKTEFGEYLRKANELHVNLKSTSH